MRGAFSRGCPWLISVSILLVFSANARADSPLTSTDLASAYGDVPAVAEAAQTGRVAGEVLSFLLSNAPTGEKAAVVNALGWKFEGRQNGLEFARALAGVRQASLEGLRVLDISPADRMVLGYLLALDDYFKLKPLKKGAPGILGATPDELLDSAARELPDDFCVAMVRALVRAQKAMNKDWCQVYRESAAVLERFAPDRRNLRPAAVASIESYMGLYEKDCPGSPAARREEREQLNQIYSLARLGSSIVVGTQGGVVVWQPGKKDPVAIFPAFICSHLVNFKDAVFAGCDRQVVRWDGNGFRSYLESKANDATYYAPMLGPGGRLWARYGRRLYAYDARRDRFERIESPWSGSPFDAAVGPDGKLWWIDFLRAICRGKERIALKSEVYPGSDPRAFYTDELGRFWVGDFNAGMFRFDDSAGRFIHEDGVVAKGMGVAWDGRREILWLLHYTDGLVQKQNGQVIEKMNLRDLNYMRDFLLDEAGDVWVGGHNQLLRLRRTEQGFERDAYRLE
ncbi:MAG: hypothetical protein GYA21_15660 [Myxococcales bacterium]|nr:hypothetical protein [Myxococcales bacterium]